MAGQTINNQPNNQVRGPVPTPGKGQITDAKMTNVGVKRGEFPDGAATVLVLDCFQSLWEQYGQRVPQECNLLFVRDTMTAEQAMDENPAIGVVIAQGLSRKTTHWMVDAIAEGSSQNKELLLLAWLNGRRLAGEPVNDWLDNYEHTRAFLKTLQRQSFGGLVQVVSRSLESYQRSELLELEGLRVQCMDKQDFFSGTFTGKVGELWERIARYERYERETGRTLSPNSGAGRHFNRLLEQAVYPHPAQNCLFDRWERELSKRGASYDAPQAMAAEMALTWLEELKLKIGSGDPRAIYEHAAQLPERRGTCDCLWNYGVAEYHWLRCFHFLHNEYNLAVWEILDMAGLMEWMRLELELDLAGQNPDYPDFGRNIRREYGEQLREFFQPEVPSESWVGWRPQRRDY